MRFYNARSKKAAIVATIKKIFFKPDGVFNADDAFSKGRDRKAFHVRALIIYFSKLHNTTTHLRKGNTLKKLFLFVFLISCVYAQPMDEYAKVIKDYFDLLKSKEYKRAYDILSPVNITLSMAMDSSDQRKPKDLPRCGYSARMNYNYWLKTVQNQNIDSLQLVKIEEIKFDYSDNSWVKQMILGFKCYIAGFKEKGNEDSESFSEKLGGYIWVVKGSDGKVRILSAGGTGP